MVNEPDVIDQLQTTNMVTGERGIDLVAIVVAMLREWKMALVVFLAVTAAGLVYVHSLKPAYVAAATFLPKGGNTEAATLTSIFQASGPGSLYIGLLRSRSVLDDVVQRDSLMKYYGTTSPEVARNIVTSRTTVAQGTDGIIVLTYRDGSAQNASTIANSYLEALQDLSDKMAQSQSAISRRFFGKLISDEQDSLDKAEDALAQHQIRTGQVAPDVQAASAIGTIASLQGQITSLQVQIQTQLKSEAETNPDVQRLRAQLGALEAEKRRQEVGNDNNGVGAPITAAKIPIAALENQRAQREVQGLAARVTALNTQYGAARQDAEFSHAAFEIIDQAIPPEFKAWPPKEPYQNASILGGLLAAFVAIILKLIGLRIWRTPEYRAMFRRLRSAF